MRRDSSFGPSTAFWRVIAPAAALLTAHLSLLTAQDLTRDRAEYASWLATAPFSPYAAVALQPIGPGLSLGPADSDIPLPDFAEARVLENRGVPYLEQGNRRRPLPRNRAVPVGDYRLLAVGSPGRSLLVVYGPTRNAKVPEFYPPDPTLTFVAPLESPERRGGFRTLGPDGLETEASEAGIITLTLPGGPARLRVYRMGGADDEEAELQIFFRDGTNGRGSYPAGRFVVLDPVGNGRYRVDFNRARNPFCAYNTVFPCPPPWPGNSIAMAIQAGERYEMKP